MGCRDVSVVNPENLCIPVWVRAGTGLRRSEHNVGVGAGIDCIAITADVVRCKVYGKLFGRKYGVVDDSNRVSFFICE